MRHRDPIQFGTEYSPLPIDQTEISEPTAKYLLVRIEVTDFDPLLRGQTGPKK
jgi:hypothetical protein